MSKFFQKDPIIKWTKVKCPLCGNPCGSKSQCYNLKSQDEQKSIMHPKLGILPVFSEQCIFRQDNVWQAEINYPVSNPLIDKIQMVDGVEKIYPIKTFTFHITVGNLFDEKDVKQAVNSVYRQFIKEMQVEESNTISLSKENIPLLVGVIFPNGQQVMVTNDSSDEMEKQSVVLRNILETFPSVKPVFSSKELK